MQLVDELRNTLADAITADIGATGFVRVYTTGLTTLLASAALENPAFGVAVAGAIALDVSAEVTDTTPVAGTAVRLGFYQNNTAASGDWRMLLGLAPSGTPDLLMPNNVIDTSDTVRVSSLIIVVPAGSADDT